MQQWMRTMPDAAVDPLSPPPTSATESDRTHSCATSQATASSDASRDARRSFCHASSAHTEAITPFSNGLVLSEDATVGVSSPLTTAATSLLHIADLRVGEASTGVMGYLGNRSTTTTTTTTSPGTRTMLEVPSYCARLGEFGTPTSTTTTSAVTAAYPGGAAGVSGVSVLHTATASASDLPPATCAGATAVQAPSLFMQAMGASDGPVLATPLSQPLDTHTTIASTGAGAAALVSRGAAGRVTGDAATAVSPTAVHHCRSSSGNSRSGEGVRDTSSPSPRGPARVPLRLHWCCVAHWRAVRRMERGVQAPAAVPAVDEVNAEADATSCAARDVYCVPAQVKRERTDGPGSAVAIPLSAVRVSDTSVHLTPEENTTTLLSVRTLPSFIAVSAASLPGTPATAAVDVAHADAEKEETLHCEFCGHAIEAYADADVEDEREMTEREIGARVGRQGTRSLSPVRRARNSPASLSPAKLTLSCASTGTMGSQPLPLSSSVSHAPSEGGEAATWATSARDAAMMAAVAMF